MGGQRARCGGARGRTAAAPAQPRGRARENATEGRDARKRRAPLAVLRLQRAKQTHMLNTTAVKRDTCSSRSWYSFVAGLERSVSRASHFEKALGAFFFCGGI